MNTNVEICTHTTNQNQMPICVLTAEYLPGLYMVLRSISENKTENPQKALGHSSRQPRLERMLRSPAVHTPTALRIKEGNNP